MEDSDNNPDDNSNDEEEGEEPEEEESDGELPDPNRPESPDRPAAVGSNNINVDDSVLAAGGTSTPGVVGAVGKRKYEDEGRTFRQEWETLFFFSEYDYKCVCLICGKIVSVFKKYNLARHYERRHPEFEINYPKGGDARAIKLEQLKCVMQEKIASIFELVQASVEQHKEGIPADKKSPGGCGAGGTPVKTTVSPFKSEWEHLFFFMEHQFKCICVICGTVLPNFKKTHLSKHFQKRHADYDVAYPKNSDLREQKFEELKVLMQERIASIFGLVEVTLREPGNAAALEAATVDSDGDSTSNPSPKFSTKDLAKALIQEHFNLKKDVKSGPKKRPEALAQEWATKASYHIALELAKSGHTYFNEESIQRCLMNLADRPNVPDADDTFDKIPLSRHTITRRMSELAVHVSNKIDQLVAEACFIGLAFDEVIDVFDAPALIIFARIVMPDFVVHEEILKFMSIDGAADNETVHTRIVVSLVERKFPFEKLVSVSTTGSPRVTFNNRGVFDRLLPETNISMTMVTYHCIVHQDLLFQEVSAGTLELNSVMKTVIKILNVIYSRGKMHADFEELMRAYEATYGDKVKHDSVHWISDEHILAAFCDLLNPVKVFLLEKNVTFHELCDPNWLAKLGAMCDLVEHLNKVRAALQKEDNLVCHMYEIIEAFQRKLHLFSAQLRSRNFLHFRRMKMLSVLPSDEVLSGVIATVDNLIMNFHKRFMEFSLHRKMFLLLQNPFVVEIEDLAEIFQLEGELASAQMELLELQSSELMRRRFQPEHAYASWKMIHQHPTLLEAVRKSLACFGSTHLFEKANSYMPNVKAAVKNNLAEKRAKEVILLATTKIEPDIDVICQGKQCQKPH